MPPHADNQGNSDATPPTVLTGADRPPDQGNDLRFSPWNLILLIPLLMLITSWYNSETPRLFGMPFFYWFQFVYVIIGVACVGIVYVKTKNVPKRDRNRTGKDDH